MNCSVCNSENNVSTKYGFPLCKDCYSKLPTIIQKRIRSYNSVLLLDVVNYENNPLFSRYEPTANFGTLSIDETNGLIGIITKEKSKKDVPFVFRATDLEHVGLYCMNGRASGSKVYCDVEYSFECPSCNFNYKRVIKSHIKCKYVKTSASQIEWIQPSMFTLFRDMYESMWNRFGRMDFENKLRADALKRQQEMEEEIRKSAEELKIETERVKAMGLFMLEDGFTQDELKKQYRKLLKAFHPDVSNEDEKYTRIIIEAYNLLSGEKK